MKTALLLLALAQTPQPGLDMDQAVKAASTDACAAPVKTALYYRYFYLPHEGGTAEEAEKALAEKVKRYNAWPNWLSREPDIAYLKRITPHVYRLNIADYGWDEKVWERLANVDPWFHQPILAEKEAKKDNMPVQLPQRAARGQDKQVWVFRQGFKEIPRHEVQPDEQFYRRIDERSWEGMGKGPGEARPVKQDDPGERADQGKAPQSVSAGAAHIGGEHYAKLIKATQSQVPIVWAPWFFQQTSQQQNRVAGYYDFIGLGKVDGKAKKKQDFLRLIGANIKVSRELRKVHRSVIGRSSVAYNNRGMELAATLTEGAGGFTEDYKDSKDRKNSLRLLNGDARYDGGEGLGNSPCGLIFMAVINADDELLDAVPPDIAGDRTSESPDFQVQAGKCFGCHEEGFRPINDWARRIYTAPFKLESPDYRLQLQLRAAYLSQIKEFIAKGNATYIQALAKLDYTPATWSKTFKAGIRDYELLDVDMEMLARWWSVKPEFMLQKFNAEVERANKGLSPKLDPALAALVQGIAIRIEWVEELNPEIYRLLVQP